MNADVFRAILAMDSYNRGYSPGVNNLTGTSLGNATILQDSSDRLGLGVTSAAGFYASAYSWNGETVISYRGTNPEFGDSVDTFRNSPGLKDIWSGWRLGAAIPFGGQPELAIKFYQDVTGRSLYDVDTPGTPEPVLVGHSLGGGLAGFVGSLSDNPVYAYDHMPYGLGAWAQAISDSYDAALVRAGVSRTEVNAVLNESTPIGTLISTAVTVGNFMTAFNIELGYRMPIFSRVYGIHTEGEALIALRDGTIPVLVGLGGSTLALVIGLGPLGALLAAASSALAVGTVQLEAQMRQRQLVDYGAVFGGFLDNPLARHSMALLTVLEYGEKGRTNNPIDHNPTDWRAAAKHILPAILSDEIGEAIGREQGADKDGIYSPGAQLASIIAYSAISEGPDNISARPFGDTGIRALFDDASDLGKALAKGPDNIPISLDKGSPAIGTFIAEYAGLLATKKILDSAVPTAKRGVLTYKTVTDAATGQTAETLLFDLRANTWKVAGESHEIKTKSDLIQGFLEGDTVDPELFTTINSWFRTNAPATATTAAGLRNLTNEIDRVSVGLTAGATLAKLSGTGIFLSVLTDGNNSFTGNSGVNFVISGNGRDILKGLGGSDILIGGAGDDQIYGGSGKDFLYGGTGSDHLYGEGGDDTLYSINGTGSTLEGGDGKDTLVFKNSSGTAVGGLKNDIIDARESTGKVNAVYNRGDGIDSLASSYKFDISTLKYSNLAPGYAHGGYDGDRDFLRNKGNVTIKFIDINIRDVYLRWDNIIITDTVVNPVTGNTPLNIFHGNVSVYERGTIDKKIFYLGDVVAAEYAASSQGGIALGPLNMPGLSFADEEARFAFEITNIEIRFNFAPVPANSNEIGEQSLFGARNLDLSQLELADGENSLGRGAHFDHTDFAQAAGQMVQAMSMFDITASTDNSLLTGGSGNEFQPSLAPCHGRFHDGHVYAHQ